MNSDNRGAVKTCPSSADWSAFARGQLSESLLEQFALHLDQCQTCSSTLQHLQVSPDELELGLRQSFEADPYGAEPVCRAAMVRLRTLIAPPPAPVLLPIPQQIGPYRLLEKLGEGNMGIVYKARHEGLQRIVALKTLSRRRCGDPTAVARFRREIEAVARLDDPHIVRASDAGEEDGILYLVMDFIEGVDLGRLLRAHGRLSVPDACELVRQAALGLDHAHRNHLVHRDIKPSNLLLGSDGIVKVLDLGLALPALNLDDEAALTSSGQVLGTLDYLAPEQARDSRAASIRSDVYALGCTLYHFLTGHVPFIGPPGETLLSKMWAHAYEVPAQLRTEQPAISPQIETLVASMLSKDPAQRPGCVADVANALEPFAVGSDLSKLLNSFNPAAIHTPREQKTVALAAPSQKIRRTGLFRAILAVAALLLITSVVLSARHWLVGRNSGPAAEASLPTDKAPEGGAALPQGPGNPPPVLPIVYPAALFAFEERGSGVRDLGGKITDLLFVKLAAKDDLVLVDREDLKKTLAEAELNLSGAVKAENATKVGQLTGAKLLITGSVIHLDKKITLVARIIGTETGRVLGASVDGKPEDLEMLAGQLADKVAEVIARKSTELVARVVTRTDRVAKLKELLKKEQGRKPTVMVKVSERHLGAATIDPAAQTELMLLLKETGFEVIDADEGSKNQADVLITGEGLSSFVARRGNLMTVKARLEVKAVLRETGKVLWVDRQTEVVIDLTEPLAGKSALQEAAGILAERLLPKLMMK